MRNKVVSEANPESTGLQALEQEKAGGSGVQLPKWVWAIRSSGDGSRSQACPWKPSSGRRLHQSHMGAKGASGTNAASLRRQDEQTLVPTKKWAPRKWVKTTTKPKSQGTVGPYRWETKVPPPTAHLQIKTHKDIKKANAKDSQQNQPVGEKFSPDEIYTIFK